MWFYRTKLLKLVSMCVLIKKKKKTTPVWTCAGAQCGDFVYFILTDAIALSKLTLKYQISVVY